MTRASKTLVAAIAAAQQEGRAQLEGARLAARAFANVRSVGRHKAGGRLMFGSLETAVASMGN